VERLRVIADNISRDRCSALVKIRSCELVLKKFAALLDSCAVVLSPGNPSWFGSGKDLYWYSGNGGEEGVTGGSES
jgi:hypothetical protein